MPNILSLSTEFGIGILTRDCDVVPSHQRVIENSDLSSNRV